MDVIDSFDSRTSSPDPLALSYDDRDTQHPMSSPRRNSPLREMSPNKRNSSRHTRPAKANASARRHATSFQLSTPVCQRDDVELSSKRSTQTFHLDTPGDHDDETRSSPLKIRVTVEAEHDHYMPESLEQNTPLKSIKRTRKVPLNDDEGKFPKRRTRSRKSEAHLLPAIAQLHDDILPVSATVSEKELLGKDDSSIPLTPASPLVAPSAQPVDGRSNIPIDFDIVTPLHKKAGNSHLVQTPRLSDLKFAISDARSIRHRVPTPRKPLGWEEPLEDSSFGEQTTPEKSANSLGVNDLARLPRSEDNRRPVSIAEEAAEETATARHENLSDEPDSHISGWDASFPDDSSLKEVETDGSLDGAKDLLDDTVALNRSAVESEGFSMVSIHSLKQQRELAEREATKSKEVIGAVEHSNIGSAHSHETATQEKNLSRATMSQSDRTPSQVKETWPSPPQLLSTSLKQSPTRKISSAMRAGNVLQEALGSSTNVDDGNFRLFAGFGDGTQKQMHRSIAMGELLANVESSPRGEDHPSSTNSRTHAAGKVSSIARLPTPDESLTSPSGLGSADQPDSRKLETSAGSITRQGSRNDSWTSVMILENDSTNAQHQHRVYDEMSWRPTTPPPTNEIASDEPHLSHTQQLEMQHNHEREKVVREAQEANTSQVMIIDSSTASPPKARPLMALPHVSAEGEQTRSPPRQTFQAQIVQTNNVQQHVSTIQLEDIFLEEADRSLEDSLNDQGRQSGNQLIAVNQPLTDGRPNMRDSESLFRALPQHTPDFNDILGPDDRPMRGKLPRTWRRNVGSGLLYSDESGGTPEQSRQHACRSLKKRGSAAYASPDEDDDVPTIFKRFRSSGSKDAPEQTSIHGSSSSARQKGVQSNLSRKSSPAFQSSPPKGVRFIPHVTVSSGNDQIPPDEDYFSSDEETRNGTSSGEDGNDDVSRLDVRRREDRGEDDDEEKDKDVGTDIGYERTLIGRRCSRLHLNKDHSSVLDHSRACAKSSMKDCRYETSDMLQLHREMDVDSTLDTETGELHQIGNELHADQQEHGSATEPSQLDIAKAGELWAQPKGSSLTISSTMNLSPRKDRGRSNLFDSPSFMDSSVDHKVPLLDDKHRNHQARPAKCSEPGIVARAALWLWPPSYFASSMVPLLATPFWTSWPKSRNLQWNQNHYILLTHYYRLAHGLHSLGPALPAAFLQSPPPDQQLCTYIGQEFTTTPRCGAHCGPSCIFGSSLSPQGRTTSSKPKTYVTKFTELDARVAWAFMFEVVTHGVPLIRGEDGSSGSGIVRDQRTGKVKRCRERWSAEEVALSVFSIGIVDTIEVDLRRRV